MKRVAPVLVMFWLSACSSIPPESEAPEPEEYWGIADLALQAFIPPILLAGEGDTIYISHLVSNIGDNVSPETTIRYYISDKSPVDPVTSVLIGERTIPSLKPKENDESMEQPFVIPAGVGGPPVFLAACVDVNDVVVELRDDNNCTINRTGTNQMPFDSGAITPGSAKLLLSNGCYAAQSRRSNASIERIGKGCL